MKQFIMSLLILSSLSVTKDREVVDPSSSVSITLGSDLLVMGVDSIDSVAPSGTNQDKSNQDNNESQ